MLLFGARLCAHICVCRCVCVQLLFVRLMKWRCASIIMLQQIGKRGQRGTLAWNVPSVSPTLKLLSGGCPHHRHDEQGQRGLTDAGMHGYLWVCDWYISLSLSLLHNNAETMCHPLFTARLRDKYMFRQLSPDWMSRPHWQAAKSMQVCGILPPHLKHSWECSP